MFDSQKHIQAYKLISENALNKTHMLQNFIERMLLSAY